MLATDPPDGGTEPFDLQPPAPEPKGRKPTRSRDPRPLRRDSPWGTTWVSVGPIIGLGFTGLAQIGITGSLTRFVAPHLGLGFELDESIVFAGSVLNLLQLTPRMTLRMLPYRRVSPIVVGGFGAAWFAGAGIYGRWLGRAGVMFAIRERGMMGLGLELDGLVPQQWFYSNFRCVPAGRGCHIGFGPWISGGVRF